MHTRRVRKVSGCDEGTCPAVHISDRGTAVVQGNLFTEAHGLTLAPGETAVELPAEILLDAMAALAEVVRQPRKALKCS